MRVLLVEDEPDMAGLVASQLERRGFTVDRAANLAQTLDAARTAQYSLVLLDRRLPDGEGLAVIPSLRRSNPGVPVIVLTALDSIGARVEGLDRGADDYIVKPFAFAELLARMRAALRRPGGDPPPPILCGGLAFDTAERTATLNGTPQVLTRRELALLEGLMLRVGRVVTRDALMQRIYGFDDDVQENTFDALVSRLRRRFAEQGAGVAIHTVRGIGYMIGPARP